MKEEEAIVIPTNTTFDTKMDDEFISVKSVQGQFQEKYFKGNLSTLDNLIEKSLEEVSYIQLERQHSKNKKYPIGTVSKVCVSGKHVYLLAVADINIYGKPEGLIDLYCEAIPHSSQEVIDVLNTFIMGTNENPELENMSSYLEYMTAHQAWKNYLRYLK